MKVLLFNDMIFETGLTHNQAIEALSKAEKTKANEMVLFYICEYSTTKGWELRGRSRELTDNFMDDPEQYVIEIGD